MTQGHRDYIVIMLIINSLPVISSVSIVAKLMHAGRVYDTDLWALLQKLNLKKKLDWKFSTCILCIYSDMKEPNNLPIQAVRGWKAKDMIKMSWLVD